MGFMLLDYLMKRRRMILAAALVFAVAGLLYVLVSDPVYESRAMLMPPMEEGGEGLLTAWMASMNLPSMIAPISAGSMSAAVMTDILGSRGVAEKVIDDLGLRKWYKSDTMDDAVRKLRGSISTSSSQVGMITLKARDRDPVMAMRIAAYHIASLDSINRSLVSERARGTLEFTSRQIESYRLRLETLRAEIAAFQEEHGIVNFDEQVRGAIDVATTLKVKAAVTEIQIDILREFSRDDAIELNKKKLELRNINVQLEKIVSGDSMMSVFPSLETLPALYQEYASLERDLEVNERVFSFLLQKHEESGIDLARTTSSVQVVDPPRVPEKKAGIPRWTFILAAFAAGGVWMSLVLAWWGWISIKKRSGEEDKAFKSVVARVGSDVSGIRRRLRF
jgi:uncharacterized protein involved in exopolysaccharide biosynthesis